MQIDDVEIGCCEEELSAEQDLAYKTALNEYKQAIEEVERLQKGLLIVF